MNGFDQLHPAVRHHIVNSLGWRELRLFQEAAIGPIVEGRHLLLLAPTAGGKTEAAFLPAISRVITEGWDGLSVLYLCPIKALLNDLNIRLERYCTLLGRRSALWHGDVGPTERRRILRDPPDCLLTTPESLEVMLTSPRIDTVSLFRGLQVVIVDEIHAFAGDDRGWHLLSVLERVSRLAGRRPQRIGLSATVGNPETLLAWLVGPSGDDGVLQVSPGASSSECDVRIDHVGSLENAAIVVSRLHRGEKRLVFLDSRARAERLSLALRELGVKTFVTHSSLSATQRRETEAAFASSRDCIIVATSVLELGIDVGDLDRVIQIDAPATVAGFPQRLGRTGRRSGSIRNCLFLATSDQSLLQAAAIVELWEQGYVEPVEPPPQPYHVLAQQLMALTLQEGGISRNEWLSRLGGLPNLAALTYDSITELVDGMLDRQILWEDQGILGLDQAGEKEYGRKNFMALFSVFLSPPVFTVLHGRQELGTVDQSTFLSKLDGPRVLLLGGRAWRVIHVDWSRRRAYVTATEARGRSRWRGDDPGLESHLCKAIRRLLVNQTVSDLWSRRSRDRIKEIRHEFAWLRPEATVLISGNNGGWEWWTFAGSRANATLAGELHRKLLCRVRPNSLTITIDEKIPIDRLQTSIEKLRGQEEEQMASLIDDEAIHGLKFSECLSPALARAILIHRMRDSQSLRKVLDERLYQITTM